MNKSLCPVSLRVHGFFKKGVILLSHFFGWIAFKKSKHSESPKKRDSEKTFEQELSITHFREQTFINIHGRILE